MLFFVYDLTKGFSFYLLVLLVHACIFLNENLRDLPFINANLLNFGFATEENACKFWQKVVRRNKNIPICKTFEH